jgi:predicted metal-binding transcription factor (methanogenesis marker protein 9)
MNLGITKTLIKFIKGVGYIGDSLEDSVLDEIEISEEEYKALSKKIGSIKAVLSVSISPEKDLEEIKKIIEEN